MWVPETSSLLWSSSWPSTRRSPARTPSRTSLRSRAQRRSNRSHTSGTRSGFKKVLDSLLRSVLAQLPGEFLEPGLRINPLAWLTSTSSCPPLSTMPTLTSPENTQDANANPAIVSAWHFYEHLYCSDSDILLLFLFLLTKHSLYVALDKSLMP